MKINQLIIRYSSILDEIESIWYLSYNLSLLNNNYTSVSGILIEWTIIISQIAGIAGIKLLRCINHNYSSKSNSMVDFSLLPDSIATQKKIQYYIIRIWSTFNRSYNDY